MRKITQTIVGTTPPLDKNVIWLDTTNSNSPVEKVFLNGAWIPTSAAGGDYYTKDEVDDNFMGKIDNPHVGNILVMDEDGKAVDSLTKPANFLANPEVSGQYADVLTLNSNKEPVWTPLTPGGDTIDTEMIDGSEHAVQNKVIKAYVDTNIGEVADALQTLINNYLEETELKSADSSIAGLFKPDGTPAASALNTYFYNVNEGDVLRIIYGAFSDGFSVVQAWNGDTFVESLLNSPTTGSGNILNYTVPQGVTKIGCSYFNNNVYLVEKVTDDLYKKIDDTNERIDNLSEGTRNLWTFANTDISYDSYIILGTTGVKLLNAGTYRLSFELNVENSELGVELIGYYLGGGQLGILHQQRSTNGRITITFTASSDIERLFFSFYSAQTGNTAQFTNIQLEILDWNGYTSSPQKGNWAALPYATPFIKPGSLNDIVSREVISYWNGKTINYNGDSITQGIGNTRIGWARVVNQILKFGKVNNYAIGGTRLAHPLNDSPVDPNETVNCMVDRYQDMSLDCDIVMIMANTNDYASQVPIGDSDSTSPNEYNGALNIIFSWIKANYKTQPIIISTMLTRKVNYDGGGQPLSITIEQYAEAVRERTAAYGFILYDAYKLSGLDLLNSATDGSGVTDDGLHPNAAGALALGRKIAAFINAQ